METNIRSMELDNVNSLPQSRDEVMGRWPKLLAEILEEIRSPADVGSLIEEFRNNDRFMTLIKGWDFMPSNSQAVAWEKIQERLWEAARSTRPYCVRCGECCRRGSPNLYDQDRPALMQGKIRIRDLMTLRTGEIAFSNRDQKMVKLARERIKLKEAAGGNTCIYLGPGGDACLIYDDRPFQCRILECWDPARFNTLGQNTPLSRLDLLGDKGPLADLVRNHEEKCAIDDFIQALVQAESKDAAGRDKAIDMILYDIHVREFAQEKAGLPKEEMEFFFGRPLFEICNAFGWEVRPDAKGEPRLRRVKKPVPSES
jgi:Fe-S-cluster containining protein